MNYDVLNAVKTADRTLADIASGIRSPYLRSSASQLATYRRCKRRWFLASPCRMKEPQHPGAEVGERCHAELERYLLDGATPGPILAPALPYFPAPKSLSRGRIERPFVLGAEAFGRVEVLGAIDVHAEDTKIQDLKTTSDMRYAKTAEELLTDPQAIIYSAVALARQRKGGVRIGPKLYEGLWYDREEPGADRTVTFEHVYARTSEPHAAKPVSVQLTGAHIATSIGAIGVELRAMETVARARRVDDVAPNSDDCFSFGRACPFTHLCRHIGDVATMNPFAKKSPDALNAKLDLEALPPSVAPPAPPAPTTPPPAVPPRAVQPAYGPDVMPDSQRTEDQEIHRTLLAWQSDGLSRVRASARLVERYPHVMPIWHLDRVYDLSKPEELSKCIEEAVESLPPGISVDVAVSTVGLKAFKPQTNSETLRLLTALSKHAPPVESDEALAVAGKVGSMLRVVQAAAPDESSILAALYGAGGAADIERRKKVAEPAPVEPVATPAPAPAPPPTSARKHDPKVPTHPAIPAAWHGMRFRSMDIQTASRAYLQIAAHAAEAGHDVPRTTSATRRDEIRAAVGALCATITGEPNPWTSGEAQADSGETSPPAPAIDVQSEPSSAVGSILLYDCFAPGAVPVESFLSTVEASVVAELGNVSFSWQAPFHDGDMRLATALFRAVEAGTVRLPSALRISSRHPAAPYLLEALRSKFDLVVEACR